ncbi:MAG TPA: hypothetical protein VEB22_15245 [Phycisphaerales bacterium]|nr:hypothetical protein [Phycisphaerales bacterium]
MSRDPDSLVLAALRSSTPIGSRELAVRLGLPVAATRASLQRLRRARLVTLAGREGSSWLWLGETLAERILRLLAAAYEPVSAGTLADQLLVGVRSVRLELGRLVAEDRILAVARDQWVAR